MHNLEDDRRGTTVPFFYRALGKQLQYHAYGHIYIYIYMPACPRFVPITIFMYIYIYIYIYIRDFYRVLGNNYWLPRGAKHSIMTKA